MQKILIATDNSYTSINGVTTTVIETAKELRKRGYLVRILSPDDYKLTIPLQPSTGIYMPLLPFGMADSAVEWADYVHVATEGAVGVATRYACRKRGKRFTTSFHTKYPEYLKIHAGIPEEITAKWFSWFHERSSCIMVPTPMMVDYCESYGMKNVKVWSRGVDHNIFHADHIPDDLDWVDDEKIRAVYVGRVSAEKNLEAFLSINGQNIRKTVIGDGPQLEYYKENFPNVEYLGRMSHNEIAIELSKHDVFVFPSLTDTFGLVLIEAMACGLSVAAFPNEINSYIVENNKSGCLNENLESAIIEAFDLSRTDAINRSKEFTWEKATDQFLKNLLIV